jgi:hypothetical protein
MDERRFALVERELEDMEELDQRRESLVRKEQALLRRLLWQEPAGFLCIVRPEVSRRTSGGFSHQTAIQVLARGEKNYRNNVLAMCRFDCDELSGVDQEKLIQRNNQDGSDTNRGKV